MIFPGIPSATNRLPLLGAGQAAPNSDPPRAAIDRSVKRPAAVKRPLRMVRVYVVGLPTPTMLPRAIPGKTLMSVPALPVAPRPRVRFPTHRPTSGVSRSHGPRMIRAHGTLSGTAADFRRVGPTVHRRPLPGHVSHHHSNRNARHLDRWLHRRRSRSHASRTADAHRERGAPLPRLHSTRRHAAMSDPDQEPAGDRVFERFGRAQGGVPARLRRRGSGPRDLQADRARSSRRGAPPTPRMVALWFASRFRSRTASRSPAAPTRMPAPRSGGSELSHLLAPSSLWPRSWVEPRRSVLQGSR
jgi:hypothetical protein